MTSSSRSTAPGDLGLTPQHIDAAPPIDLGLENLLRQCDVKEPVIQAFRVRGITDRLQFVALDETTEGLRNTCKEALGVDTNLNFEHKLEFAKISKAWSSAKIAAETKEKIDAVHRAHGEPVQMLEGDLIRAFKVKYGRSIHPSRLPQEEERQKALRPEPARSVGIHLDGSLSIQTQRRFMSSVPTTIEDLRTKYKVVANMFLLAQMRQPSRHLSRGLEVNTFSDFLDELLSDQNFLMESDDDERLVIPPWNQCLNYEFNIRKDAVRLCMEEGFALKDALWHVLADKEHRMQHWILKLTIANARQDTSKVQKLEQRLAALEKQRRVTVTASSSPARVASPATTTCSSSEEDRKEQERERKRKEPQIRVSPLSSAFWSSQCQKTI